MRLHKHHTTHHFIGFLIGVLLIGGALGGLSGLLGQQTFESSDATGIAEGRSFLSGTKYQRLVKQILNRRERRAERLQNDERVVKDIGTTYPMRVNTFAYKGTTNWNVAMHVATLSYEQLGIEAPLGKPGMKEWNNRNWRGLEDQMQYLLLNGLAMYPHSPNLGDAGSVIIAGHSSAPTMKAIGSPYEEVLSKPPSAKIGDRITVTDGEGNRFLYKVRSTEVVPASYTKLLLQDPSKKELVMFTCYPVGTTRERFVVWADLVEGAEVAKR